MSRTRIIAIVTLIVLAIVSFSFITVSFIEHKQQQTTHYNSLKFFSFVQGKVIIKDCQKEDITVSLTKDSLTFSFQNQNRISYKLIADTQLYIFAEDNDKRIYFFKKFEDKKNKELLFRVNQDDFIILSTRICE